MHVPTALYRSWVLAPETRRNARRDCRSIRLTGVLSDPLTPMLDDCNQIKPCKTNKKNGGCTFVLVQAPLDDAVRGVPPRRRHHGRPSIDPVHHGLNDANVLRNPRTDRGRFVAELMLIEWNLGGPPSECRVARETMTTASRGRSGVLSYPATLMKIESSSKQIAGDWKKSD